MCVSVCWAFRIFAVRAATVQLRLSVVQNSILQGGSGLLTCPYTLHPNPYVFFITAGECVDPLVSGLYASSFLASSRYNFLYSANFAKLYGKFSTFSNSR